MADKKHLKILKRGVAVWNQWHQGDYKTIPDLYNADLHKANLIGAHLGGAILYKADLSKAKLMGASLCRADLSSADLNFANLSKANLSKANLSYADFSKANLRKASLIDADLTWANLREANLTEAHLEIARLINAKLDGANLTGAHLWETQRAGWSIKGIICEYVYWDERAKEKTEYAPGEFERLFSEQTKIRLFYKGGINPLEVATLPALIQHLEDAHPRCRLSLLTIKSDFGGAVVELAVEEDESSVEQLQKFLPSEEAQTQEQIGEKDASKLEAIKEQLQPDAQLAVQRLRQIIQEKENLQGQVNALQWVFTQMLNKGTGDTYNLSGQAGAIGPNSHAEHNTLTSTPAKKTEDE
jgi:hypothetical protein